MDSKIFVDPNSTDPNSPEMRDATAADNVGIRGFYRLRIRNQDGSIAGETPWLKNQVTNLGFNQYLVLSLGSIAGSKYITHLALGTGTAPGATDTTLAGEVQKRQAVTAASSSSSKRLRLTGTFSSSDSFITAASENLSNIGLFNTSSGGTIFAGNTYASSAVASNQNVEVTYDLDFA